MTKKITLLLIFALMVVGISGNAVEASDVLAEESIEVRVNIPVMQQMNVIEPAVIEYDFSEADVNNGEAIVVEEAGVFEVKSNADWSLKLDNFTSGNLDVMVRRSDDHNASWQTVDAVNGYINGSNGTEKVAIDVKVVPGAGATAEAVSGQVELGYTLAQN